MFTVDGYIQRRSARSFALIVVCLGCAATANADAIINGSFENGFQGWSTIGVTSIQSSGFGSGPVDGAFQALAESTHVAGAATITALEEFLELPAGTLFDISTGTPREGSALKQTFSAELGDIVSFQWNFLTNEFTELDPPPSPDFNDYTFVTISSTEVLDDTFSNFFLSSTLFDFETDFSTFLYKILADGSYTLGIGVVNVGDFFVNSGVLVDNVRLTSVHEPDSVAMWMLLVTVVLCINVCRSASRHDR